MANNGKTGIIPPFKILKTSQAHFLFHYTRLALCTNFTSSINKSINFYGIVPASINIIVYEKYIIILDLNLTPIADYGST